MLHVGIRALGTALDVELALKRALAACQRRAFHSLLCLAVLIRMADMAGKITMIAIAEQIGPVQYGFTMRALMHKTRFHAAELRACCIDGLGKTRIRSQSNLGRVQLHGRCST